MGPTRFKKRTKRVAYGDEEVPTRFSSRTGGKVSYAESDGEGYESGGADSRLVESTGFVEYTGTPKVYPK